MGKVWCLLAALFMIIPLLSGCVTYNNPPPEPPPQAEVVGMAPYPAAVWVKGHWAWRHRRGGYVWVPGHWRGTY